MQPLPHLYAVTAVSEPIGAVAVTTEEGATMDCFPPSHFGGEKGTQSPEYLLSEAVASCYILSFRAVATAAKLEWTQLRCEAVGKLDKGERGMSFADYRITAHLRVPSGTNEEQALKLLDKAERICLISNSLNCEVHLEATVEVA